MIKLRRIGVVSAARVAFFFALATTFVNIIFALFMIIVIQGVPISVFPPEIWGQLALNVLISSLVMAVGVGLFAFIYNFGMGGLELEFEMHDGLSPKRKNGETMDIDDEIEID